MGSAASTHQTNPPPSIHYLATCSSNERKRISSLPQHQLFNIIQSVAIPRLTSNVHPTTTPKFPCCCPFKCDTPHEKYFTKYDLKFHIQDNHICSFVQLLQEPKRSSSNVALVQSLMYLNPGELIDVSNTCSWLYLASESRLLWRPWGKGVFSRVYKTYQVANRASALVKVTGKVMKSAQQQLNQALKNVTALVEGNRIEYLKVHKPNTTQYTTASALLALLLLPPKPDTNAEGQSTFYQQWMQDTPIIMDSHMNDSRAPDYDSFRRICTFMREKGVEVPNIENKLQQLNVFSVPSASMLKARPFIETLRRDMQSYNGLNPSEFVSIFYIVLPILPILFSHVKSR
jgi:hypothetical protein